MRKTCQHIQVTIETKLFNSVRKLKKIRRAVVTWKCSRNNEKRALSKWSIQEIKVSIEYNLKINIAYIKCKSDENREIMNFAR